MPIHSSHVSFYIMGIVSKGGKYRAPQDDLHVWIRREAERGMTNYGSRNFTASMPDLNSHNEFSGEHLLHVIKFQL